MARLETPRLIFRNHQIEDLEAFLAMESDPLYRHPQPVHPTEELIRSFHQAWMTPKRMGLYATVLKDEGRYIGRCGLYPVADEQGSARQGQACLAFYLARDCWGRGLATEAGAFLVRHGFEGLGLERIEAGVNEENLASIRVLEKLDFRLVEEGEGGGNRWRLYERLIDDWRCSPNP